jgi:mannose-6-phosphate isomerase
MAPPNTPVLQPFRLEKQYRDYVWGGSRLRPGHIPTAEAWAIYENNQVVDGLFSGRSLAEAAEATGADLLGSKVIDRIGKRFPVLVKILDCNQWLSLQVHPDDRQAEEMEGQGQFGKTEAWYFLETTPAAEILCGTKPGVTAQVVETAVRHGTILEQTNRVKVSEGEFVLIPAGTIHALGPGMLVYEVQESSDITYRVFDWNRPADQGRILHIEQSIKVINPALTGEIKRPVNDQKIAELLSCPYFALEKLDPSREPIQTVLDGTTFHAITVVRGTGLIYGEGWNYPLKQFDSLVIPASTRDYTVDLQPGCELLRVTA